VSLSGEGNRKDSLFLYSKRYHFANWPTKF